MTDADKHPIILDALSTPAPAIAIHIRNTARMVDYSRPSFDRAYASGLMGVSCNIFPKRRIMLLAAWAGTASIVSPTLSILLLGVSAVASDAGLATGHTFGRRAINLVRPEARGRVNGLVVGLFSIVGAIEAVLSGVTWSNGGWWLTCLIGAALALFALILDFPSARRDAQIATERDPAPTSTTG